MRAGRIPVVVLLAATWAAGGTPRDLHLAARSGDLAEVERLLEAGVPVDAADEWGTTALLLAVGQNRVEVAGLLLDRGANPSVRETFFGATALGTALWKGAPDYAIAKRLLAAGAEGRADALAVALESGDLPLARAAAGSGPLTESEAADLRARFGSLEGEIGEVLASATTRPDPPPPEYGPGDLARFAGTFEAGPDGPTATVSVRENGLVLEIEGDRIPVAASEERVFRNREAGVALRYWGRAGTVERLSVERRGSEPLGLRVADTDVLAAYEPPQDVTAAPAPRVHWPGFRGANRDGIGDGAPPPVDFDLGAGTGVAWRVALPGLGNSSPVVWGERVFVTTAVASGGSVPIRTGLTGAGDEIEEDTLHRWLVLAFDKRTGEKLWETEVGRGVPLTRRHFKATQANSSPATDGEHVVVVFPTAGLACLGVDGKLHWKRDLGGLNAGGFNDPGLQWGFASSPVLHDGKVLLQVDIHDGPYLAAWDLDTGKPLWKTERPGIAPSWSTPAIWPTGEGDEVVVNASVIHGYDPDDGKLLWTLGPTSVQVVAAPVVGRDRLYVSSGYPPVRPIYAVEPGIRGAHEIDFGAETIDAALAWGLERGGAYMPTPLLYRGLLYVVHHNGRIAVHDARTGGVVYKARFSAGGTMTSSPVAANGTIYQGSEEGTLYVLEAGPEYREIAVHDFGAPLMATPAISEGYLIVRTPAELIALRRPHTEQGEGGTRSE